MIDLQAYAERKNGVINVSVMGTLPSTCWSAKITDQYPGGNINYVVDPGSAQVFIEETAKPNHNVCLMMLLPWAAHVSIPDNHHNKVTVFINGGLSLTTDIVSDEPSSYIVIALTTSIGDCFKGCSIVPANAPILGIYSTVFGPDTKDACANFMKEKCSCHDI